MPFDFEAHFHQLISYDGLLSVDLSPLHQCSNDERCLITYFVHSNQNCVILVNVNTIQKEINLINVRLVFF